jgi:hypothetical protein
MFFGNSTSANSDEEYKTNKHEENYQEVALGWRV